ncbi:C39 family peptidase [Microcoleus sp. FACHB-672]|uniref:C39 family peptidase n=1 Tax=Microcoleus sp. FACHB-672 TaxID=2692825 RepID=UPI0016868A18|nr:C39 family peptidase [Microcoleus sp. FACHB-672]MBD2041689.1 C39 family peptidase [Microcoleus sp. FACHB-672]
MKVIQGVPYFSQLDNKFEPYTACNVTSLAMCLWHLGVRGNGSQRQLEDELYTRAVDNGWNRFTTSGLKGIAESYAGIKDDLTEKGTLKDIREAIDQEKICIVHGFFTAVGHILVIKGYTDNGFIVNDPNGEWSPWTYDKNEAGGNNKKGESVEYSNKAITACCDSWSIGEAEIRYFSLSDSQAEKEAETIWLHRIYKDKTRLG